MRPHLAWLWLASSLGGCSLLYNPSNIGTPMDGMPDMPFDAPIDGDPALLSLTAARPPLLYEGQGFGGSRPAILVIEGANIVKQNTTVTVAPTPGETKTPTVTIDNSQLETSADGSYLVVPLTIAVDRTGLLKTDQVKLDITVAQDGPGGRISKTISGVVKVQGLAELEGALPATELSGGEHLYSVVNITGPVAIGPAAGATTPILVHSYSSLTIASSVTLGVNASGITGGPAGGNGGTGGAATIVGTTPGAVGQGPAGGAPSGNGGGFTTDVQVPTLDVPQRGSGGSGGVGTTASAGQSGGGGGGTISLLADGDLSVGTITALGGAAAGSGSAGGGGSGGVILIRAGHNLSATQLDVAGSSNGAAGHARFDAGGTAVLSTAGAAFRGPMFVDPPLITTSARPAIMVAGKPLSSFRYFIQNANGSMIRGPFGGSIPGTGPGVIGWGSDADEALFPGLNQLCVVVGSGDASSDTANCMAIAWIAR
jgi:hypothetical protein